MDRRNTAHHLKSLSNVLDIPITYSSSEGTVQCFRPFPLEGGPEDMNFILSRLQPALQAFPNRSAMYVVTAGLVMLGIAANRETGEFVLIGPIASRASTPADIRGYLQQAGLDEGVTAALSRYLEHIRPLAQDQLLELLSGIHSLLCGAVLPPEEIPALYDSRAGDRTAFAQQEYFRESARQDALDTEGQSLFSARVAFCVENGDLEGLYALLGEMAGGADGQETSTEELRILSIGSVFAAEGAALRSGIPSRDLEKTKRFYLGRIAAAVTQEELQHLTVRALFDFTRDVKAYLPVRTGNPTINRAITYIKANLNTRIRAEDIAASLGVNPHYLHSRFRLETGRSISEFVNAEKIKKACYYLQFTDKSLSEIASFLSYSSQSHFQAAFKKVMCQTPTQWRRRNDYAR